MARQEQGPLPPDDAAHAGQREYTPGLLRIYDPLVLGLYCRLVWRCPAALLTEHYVRHVRPRHLDVGPGTGYFLRRSEVPAPAELTLLDPNRHVLAHAARRLAHLNPDMVQADVCKPLPLAGQYGSVACNLVWHCLPATGKAAAIRHVAAALQGDGVLFGATVLGTPQLHTRLSRTALQALNRRGVFDNLDDNQELLRRVLQTAFEHTEIDVVGSVAVFTASTPRRRDGSAPPRNS